MFLRNIKVFFENIKVFFAAWECAKTKPTYPILKDMKCSASILLSDESIAYHIFPALGH